MIYLTWGELKEFGVDWLRVVENSNYSIYALSQGSLTNETTLQFSVSQFKKIIEGLV